MGVSRTLLVSIMIVLSNVSGSNPGGYTVLGIGLSIYRFVKKKRYIGLFKKNDILLKKAIYRYISVFMGHALNIVSH